jgi:hypothetical protein
MKSSRLRSQLSGAARSRLLFPAAELMRDLAPKERQRFVSIGAHQSLPHCTPYLPLRYFEDLAILRRVRPVSREVWGITMVRNEADIIEYTVSHLLGEGLDRLLIADNLSDDETPAILRRLASAHPVTVISDTLPAYLQAQKMTRLARYAAACGAEWIVPFDADELWTTVSGDTLAETLRNTNVDILRVPMWTHIPTPSDSRDPNPFSRLQHRVSVEHRGRVVAFRAHRLAYVRFGNLSVRRPGRADDTKTIEVRHFPFRSLEQLTSKLRHGRDALEATDLSRPLGRHWRTYADLDPSRADAIREFLEDHYMPAGSSLVFDPAHYRG